jgi:hypothetical protein
MQFPDVDVSADVIRSQIKEDSLQAAELAEFDPFEGNLLDIATGHDRTKYLVFPTGELGSELSKLSNFSTRIFIEFDVCLQISLPFLRATTER